MKRISLYFPMSAVHKAESKKFECDTCCKKFVRKYSLATHLISHIPSQFRERNFPCDVCGKVEGKVFFPPDISKKHLLVTHVSSEPVSCYCGETFSCKINLKQHNILQYLRKNHLKTHSNLSQEQFEKLVKSLKLS